MSALAFTIPGAPVPCARARVFADRATGKIRAARPAKTASYERHVRTCAQLAANLAKWRPLDEPCAVTLRIYRAALRGDWDNYAKACLDGMNGVVFVDDRHVVAADVAMFLDRKNPRVEVRVERTGAIAVGGSQ